MNLRTSTNLYVDGVSGGGGASEESIDGARPQTFVRRLSTPAGLPWEQRRAAELEAKMGAPASLSALRYQLIRTRSWRPGAPGEFAAAYLRGAAGEDVVADVDAGGRTIQVKFQSPEARRHALIQRSLRLGAVLAPIALTALALLVALAAATDRENRIQALELKSARAALVARRLQDAQAEAKLIASAGVQGRRPADVLADLQWIKRNRTGEAHIQAVRWEAGLMTITVRGETPPVAAVGRELRRAERPVAPWLYLWGIGPSAEARP